ncbi:MAG: hypothetical protein AcusKO_00340 [Acuticoccus sp.]
MVSAATGWTPPVFRGSSAVAAPLAPPSPGTAAEARPFTPHLPLAAKGLIAALFVPFAVPVGSLLLSPSRLYLILAVVPCLFLWLSGAAGRVRAADILLLLLTMWTAISLAVVHGASAAIEPSGIFFIETMGAFLLARCTIRSAEAFHAMIGFLFKIALVLFPFAMLEALTGRNLILEVANGVLPSFRDVPKEARLGLDRVQSVFEHPIHFGVVFGAIVAPTYYVLGYARSAAGRLSRTAFITFMAFLALSSGPLTAVIMQFLIMAWDRCLWFFRARWLVLLSGALVFVLLVELFANRSLPAILIDHFSFNSGTAYNRLRIWEYGSASVANNPVFGIGFNEWERPAWMTGSMDMFWLLPGVQNGLPAALLLQFAFIGTIIAVSRRAMPDERSESCKMGFLICLVGLYAAGWTVHYWKAVYVLFMFIWGSGFWLLDLQSRASRTSGAEDPLFGDRVAPQLGPPAPA